MSNQQRIRDELLDENPEALLFDNMHSALVGYGRVGHQEPVAVYSKKLMYAQLQRDGFSIEDAEEYFAKFVNTWAGEQTPVILEDLSEE